MMSRRAFLKAAASFTMACVSGNAFASDSRERVLNLYHLHTGEHLAIPYFVSGAYDTQALDAISRLLRCHFTNEVTRIDVRLVDLLYAVKELVGEARPVEVVSGYRSPTYNTHLKSLGRRVASGSLHIQGRAIDFSLPGASARQLAYAARSLAAGGVGEYRDFVHIDVGTVRYW